MHSDFGSRDACSRIFLPGRGLLYTQQKNPLVERLGKAKQTKTSFHKNVSGRRVNTKPDQIQRPNCKHQYWNTNMSWTERGIHKYRYHKHDATGSDSIIKRRRLRAAHLVFLTNAEHSLHPHPVWETPTVLLYAQVYGRTVFIWELLWYTHKNVQCAYP